MSSSEEKASPVKWHDDFGCNINSIKSKINGLKAEYGCEMTKVNKTRSGQIADEFYVKN